MIPIAIIFLLLSCQSNSPYFKVNSFTVKSSRYWQNGISSFKYMQKSDLYRLNRIFLSLSDITSDKTTYENIAIVFLEYVLNKD